MGYLHIDNLYKDQRVLLFQEVYALEKIHGTSAHISFETVTTFEFGKPEAISSRVDVHYFNGGENRERFLALFNEAELVPKFNLLGVKHKLTIYGEAYGGKQQGMSATYGKELRFIAFDVKIGDWWLNVPNAHRLVESLGLEFVAYEKVPATVECLDAERDYPSIQARRNGISDSKIREGIIIRPLEEMLTNGDKRVIAKHKADAFKETAKPRPVLSPEKLQILENANAIADEWVTLMRLHHILGKRENPQVKQTGEIISEMIEDVKREAAGEIVWNNDVRKAIAKATSRLLNAYFQSALRGR